MQQDTLTKMCHNSYKLLYGQIILVAIVMLIWFLGAHTFDAATSILLGGAAWFLPSVCFIKCCINKRTLLQPQLALKRLFLAELIKLLLSALLIILSIKLVPQLQIIPFLSGFSAAIFAPFLVGRFM